MYHRHKLLDLLCYVVYLLGGYSKSVLKNMIALNWQLCTRISSITTLVNTKCHPHLLYEIKHIHSSLNQILFPTQVQNCHILWEIAIWYIIKRPKFVKVPDIYLSKSRKLQKIFIWNVIDVAVNVNVMVVVKVKEKWFHEMCIIIILQF
jgi:hypothetical protein